MVWPTGMPKCPVSPEDRGEDVERDCLVTVCTCRPGPCQYPAPSPDALLPCPFCGGPAVNVAFEYITCGAAWNRKCPGHQLQCSEAAWNTRTASQTPMVADIEQILTMGHANGKTRFEIAEDIVREFSLSRPECK